MIDGKRADMVAHMVHKDDSVAQLTKMRKYHHHNYRPIKPRNGRLIEKI